MARVLVVAYVTAVSAMVRVVPMARRGRRFGVLGIARLRRNGLHLRLRVVPVMVAMLATGSRARGPMVFARGASPGVAPSSGAPTVGVRVP